MVTRTGRGSDSGQIPDPYGSVMRSRREPAPVGGKGQRVNAVLVPFERGRLFAGGEVPEQDFATPYRAVRSETEPVKNNT